MAKFYLAIATALFFTAAFAACHSVEKSASMAFDNANSALKTGEDKLWVEPDAKPTPAAEKY